MSAPLVNRIDGNGSTLPLDTLPLCDVTIPVAATSRPPVKGSPPLADLSRWLQLARGFLSATTGRPEAGELRVTLRNEVGDRVTYLLAGAEILRSPEGVVYALSPTERRIVQVIANSERGLMVAKKIASKTGIPYDGTLRVLLSNLTKREPPVLESTGLGYRVLLAIAQE